MMKFWCYAAWLVTCSGAALAYTKHWTRSWNLDDDDNWSGGLVHCPGQRLQMPQRLDYMTYLSSSLSVEWLALPLSGEVVLGEGGSVLVGTAGAKRRPSDCKAEVKTLTWSRTSKDEWWDALSWQVPDDLTLNSSAIPDLNRVPCTTDTVVLRSSPKYLSPIHFTAPTVRVASVQVNGQTLTTSGLLDYASGNVSGQLTGSSADGGVLLYAEADPRCSEGRDCQCNDAADVARVVCTNRQLPCPEPMCENPIRMQDFCCPQCGVDFKLPSSYSGGGRHLQGLLGALDVEEAGRGVARFSGLMSDGSYHVLLAARERDGDYEAAAQVVRRILQQAVGSDGHLEESAAGASAYKTESGSSSAGGLVSAIVIIVLVALLLYFVHKRGYADNVRALLRENSPASFQFRRMSMVAIRRLSRISLHADALSARRASDAPSSRTPDMSGPIPTYSVQSGGLRFMNPVFSKSTASLAAMPIDPEGGMCDDAATGRAGDTAEVENPMYGAFMHMTHAEKKAYDATDADAGPPKPPRLEDKGQSSMRFSELGTIDEDVHSTEDDANEIVTDEPQRLDKNIREIISLETPAELARAGLLIDVPGDSPVTGQMVENAYKNNDGKGETKIVIDIHAAPFSELEQTKSDDAQHFGATASHATADRCQLEEVDDEPGINFGFEDDDEF
ncbi:protein amnionless [Hyalella azteca]|uniref:Protein amnionless n=1 Tax=Hyalella azteca TaxID=294128 RepID=A0A8B7P5C0_HYAAZ|nr:protein amnionless [Hyalella azteca]